MGFLNCCHLFSYWSNCFLLRKKIPGLAEYDKEDEETIAKDNLSRILVDVPEKKDEKEEKKTDDENK